MSISLISAGAYVSGLNNTITPVAGGAYAVGDAIIYITGEAPGSDTIDTPVGWTLLSADIVTTQVKIFGRFATSTSETIPGVNWSAANRSYAQLMVFRGVDPSFTSTMPGTAERSANVPANLISSASSKTPTQDGSLGIWNAVRTKTTTTNGTAYSPASGWTIGAQASQTGSGYSTAVSYWIQTTATAVPANSAMTGSLTEGANQAMRSTMIFLAPAPPPSGGGGTGTSLFPPTKRKTYVFYDLYYPR